MLQVFFLFPIQIHLWRRSMTSQTVKREKLSCSEVHFEAMHKSGYDAIFAISTWMPQKDPSSIVQVDHKPTG